MEREKTYIDHAKEIKIKAKLRKALRSTMHIYVMSCDQQKKDKRFIFKVLWCRNSLIFIVPTGRINFHVSYTSNMVINLLNFDT